MNIRRISIREVAEILGFLSVVASLVFVGLEIQQNSAVSRVQSQQATTTIMSEASVAALQDPELAELVIAANTGRIALQDLDTAQSARLYFWSLLTLQGLQSLWLSVQSGISPESDLDGLEGGDLINPYMKSRWNVLKRNLNPGFAAYIESIANI